MNECNNYGLPELRFKVETKQFMCTAPPRSVGPYMDLQQLSVGRVVVANVWEQLLCF